MTIQLATSTRNAMLDAWETDVGTSPTLELRTGAQPGSCAAADSGTLLASMALPSDFMAAASAGSKALSGTWQDLSADAAGSAAHFRLKQGATCKMQGSVTATGGGGDMTLDNAVIALAQQVQVTTFTLTMPGA